MIIKCTMEEYTRIIRMCQRGKDLSECQGCVMGHICYDDVIENAVEFEIKEDDELDLEYITFERSE